MAEIWQTCLLSRTSLVHTYMFDLLRRSCYEGLWLLTDRSGGSDANGKNVPGDAFIFLADAFPSTIA